MWDIVDFVVLMLQVVSVLPQDPRLLCAQAPNWVRWPIYTVIVLAVLLLVFTWILLLFV